MKSFFQNYIIKLIFIGTLFFISNGANAQIDSINEAVFAVNKKLGRGINIPNIERMNAKHYQDIKEAGFSNLRIPIAPFDETVSKTDFTLKPSFFKMLDEAINNSLANNLMPIIDFHQHHVIQKDPLGVAPAFYAIWQQIAEHYKDAPSEVLFEIANEPNVKPDLWNDFYKMAYRIIRKSNPNRTILIGTVYGNQIKFLKDLKLPEEDRNIIVTVHYYEPIEFTHQGAEWSAERRDLSGITWPGKYGGEKEIIADFNIAQTWSVEHQRPIHLGEFGVYNKTEMKYRIIWTAFVARLADKLGWSWSYWELNQGFGIYDLKTNEWNEGLYRALIPKKK
ncbi:glycoside hydrolase family 5 protein [Yeosuana marina]|uniref:glycoside hydrolase family 5 protein n=1 Tax=Yeosuana marina TaxID=1565536 RepID=UPI0030C81755